MKSKVESQKYQPPRLLPSIVAGFNVIANNIYVIFFPICLDLLIWFGPRFRIKNLLKPFIENIFSPTTSFPPDITNTLEINSMIQTAEELWQFVLDHFNMLVILRSYPIGIPSLFSALGPVNNPIIIAPSYEISSIYLAILTLIILYLAGLFFGCVYFNEINRHTGQQTSKISLKIIIWQFLQIIGLSISFLIIICFISIPSIIIITILTFINPIIAQIGILLIGFIILWLIIPLTFSAHGIFVNKQNFIYSMLSSIRLVRFTFPTTGLFILVVLLMSQGLDVLWRSPSDSSWMSLIGILGHAFISTSLIAASFFYYRGGISWIQEMLLSRLRQNGAHSQT